MGNTATDKLFLARRTFAALTARAAAVNELLEALRASEIRLKCGDLVGEVAQAVYFSSRYDACSRYASLEEFEHELRMELDEELPSVEEAGTKYYVLRPYFNDRSFADHLTGSKVLSLMHLFYWYPVLANLSVERYLAPAGAHITGISDSEIEVLAGDYLRRSVAIVNALRTLETALTAARSRFSRENPDALGVTLEVRSYFTRMAELVPLPNLPPTAHWFGSEADKINPLSALPEAFIHSMATA